MIGLIKMTKKADRKRQIFFYYLQFNILLTRILLERYKDLHLVDVVYVITCFKYHSCFPYTHASERRLIIALKRYWKEFFNQKMFLNMLSDVFAEFETC